MKSTIDVLNGIISGDTIPKAVDFTDTPAEVLREAQIKKNEYKSRLKNGIWMVEFTKVDGTPTAMECTLDARYVPPSDAQTASTTAIENPTVLRVYAVDRNGWRSFKVLNVTRFYQKPEHL